MSHEAMAVVAEQRERLAERIRPPWWYWTVMTAATVAILVSQVVDARVSSAVAQAVIWPGIAVYVVTDALVWRSRGLRYPWSPRAFPGTFGPTVVAVLVLMVLIGAIRGLSVVSAAGGLVAAAVGVVVTMGLFVWMQRTIRSDIRSGRVRP